MVKTRTKAGGVNISGTKKITAKVGIGEVSQVIDMRGIRGDSADNMPGCPGVSEKTAVK